MYQYGPGNSGKDTEHAMQLSFFGDGSSDGLSGAVGSSYVVSKGCVHRDGEATTSVVGSIRGLRCVANNGIPDGAGAERGRAQGPGGARGHGACEPQHAA